MELPGALVSASWLLDRSESPSENLVVVDSRWYLDGRSGHAAYQAGHIPGAVFADLDTDLSDPPRRPGGRHPLPTAERFAEVMGSFGVGDTTPVVVYDDCGGGIAARLWWMLHVLGHPVAVLDGGIDEWVKAAGPGALSTESVGPKAASFTTVPWPEDRFVAAGDIEAHVAGGGSLLDGRSVERFRGEENPIDPRFGHIPGASSAAWTDNLDESGTMADLNTLGDRFSALGVHRVGAVSAPVAYCGSGVTACHNLLALHRIGVEGRLYVGSWSEWGADEARPLETGDR